jgi:predicted HTH domain antitoxin
MELDHAQTEAGAAMTTLELPISDAIRELGYTNEEIVREVPRLLVLNRFRQKAISSGKAARILGMSRRDFLELLGREGIPIYDPTEEELAEELATLRKLGT